MVTQTLSVRYEGPERYIALPGTKLMVSDGVKLNRYEMNDLLFHYRQEEHGRIGKGLYFKYDTKRSDIYKQAAYMQDMHEKLPSVVPNIESFVYDQSNKETVGVLMPFIDGEKLTRHLHGGSVHTGRAVAKAFVRDIVLGLLAHGDHGDFSTDNMIVSFSGRRATVNAIDLIPENDGAKRTDKTDEMFYSAEILFKLGLESRRFDSILRKTGTNESANGLADIMVMMEELRC